MVTTTNHLCKATRRDGRACQAYAGESGFCLAHDPARAGEIAEARRKGGKARHGRKLGDVRTPPAAVTLGSMSDVLALLERTAGDSLQLENSLNRARTLTYIAQTWAKCFEVSELERRLAAVEQRLHDGPYPAR